MRGVATSSGSPKVSLLASSNNKAVGATAQRHLGQPWPWSLFALETYPIGWGTPPSFCMRTTKAVPCFSAMCKRSRLFKLGRPRAGAPVRACLISLKAFLRSPFQSNASQTEPFSSVQSLSHIQLFATPWIRALQASLSITNSQNLLKLMSTEPVMPSNHLILYHPFFLPPSIFPSIRVFSK